MILKLAQLAVKIPSTDLRINNISLELYEQTGWVIVEGEVILGDGESTSSLTSVILPLEVSQKELLELFKVVKTGLVPSRRRRVSK